MNWLHACYSIGATFGPLIMTAFLVQSGSWRAGYAVVGTVMLLLAFLFFATRRLWQNEGEQKSSSERGRATEHATVRETLTHGTVWVQIPLFFVYTGLEVTVGQWSFTLLTESRHINTSAAGLWVTLYWGSIGVGRVLFGFVVEWIGIDRLLRASTIAAIIGALSLALFTSSLSSLLGLVLIGLALAPIYPSMMTRTPQRLGPALAAHAIGFQVAAAMLGAAALPGVTGVIAQQTGLANIPLTALTMAGLLWLLHETLLHRPVITAQR
jgi:fucose permease